LLDALSTAREAARQAEIDTMRLALDWADMHSTDSIDHAATVPGTDRAIAIAGDGAPLVAEFAIVELATTLGRSTDSAKLWLGDVLEIRYRLPKIWRRILDGPLEPWKARMIARHTHLLPAAGAAWVDHQLAPVAHKTGPAQLERTITHAIARFDPARAEADAAAAAEHRHVTLHHQHPGHAMVEVTAILDAIDAHDLDQAVRNVAHDLATAGSDQPLDVRRAQALGEIARHELTLHLTTPVPTHSGTGSTGEHGSATLYVHLDGGHDDTGDDDAAASHGGQPLARIEKLAGARDFHLPLDRLGDWLTRLRIPVTIRPVLDLNQTITNTGYQPSPRLREQTILRNPTCVFPHCTRSARTADLDHIQPWEQGGATSSQNLAGSLRQPSTDLGPRISVC